jgi:hypothetical protein
MSLQTLTWSWPAAASRCHMQYMAADDSKLSRGKQAISQHTQFWTHDTKVPGSTGDRPVCWKLCKCAPSSLRASSPKRLGTTVM